MLNRYVAAIRLLLLCLFAALAATSAHADDPGITKARLIQQSDTSYIFEADVPQLVLSSIKKPILPDRFTYSEFELTNQSGWITLQTIISTSGTPFNQEDEILLPWLRNGVDFTAQWKDGGTFKGLFYRTLEGIHIPLAEVMPTSKSMVEVLSEGFEMGLSHVSFKLIHLVFIVAIAWMLGSIKKIGLLLWWSLGQASAMVLGELGMPGVDLLFADLLVLLLSIIVAYVIARQKQFRYLWVALVMTGMLHGLSFLHEVVAESYSAFEKVQALFAFNLVMDAFQFGVVALLIVMSPALKRALETKRFAIQVGSVCVFLMLLVFSDHVSTSDIRVLREKDDGAKMVRLPAPTKQSLQQVQRGAGAMTAPMMAFLSVEPYEIRQEVLIRAQDIVNASYPDLMADAISVQDQDWLKSALSDSIVDLSSIALGDQFIEPVDVDANFVRLSRGGVFIREAPIEELLDEAIIGVTLIYDIASFPQTIQYQWGFFPEATWQTEASVVDPYGTITTMLSSDQREMDWENRLSGFELPTVEPIPVQHYPLPWSAIVLWVVALSFLIFFAFRRKEIRHKKLIISVIAVGFVLYPIHRTESWAPFLPEWTPSKERSTIVMNDLLTNVYRAFDRRKEDDVYDRLAKSVTGEQLTEIYLSNRQAMSLENQGGARAKVDEVNIMEVLEVNPAEESGFVADVSWTVRGSVNHFGHTHYRQNQYRALVTFVEESGVWKISSIETIDEKRIY